MVDLFFLSISFLFEATILFCCDLHYIKVADETNYMKCDSQEVHFTRSSNCN